MLISVINYKGGQGKSTWAAILADWANADLIDLDLNNGDTWAWAKKAERVCQLPRQGEAEKVLVDAAADKDRWFVADCPPHDHTETRHALQHSHLVLVPLVPGGAQDARAWGRMMDALNKARTLNPGLKAAVVLNAYRQTAMAREFVEMLKEWHQPKAGQAVLGVLPQRVAIAEAYGAGKVPWDEDIAAILKKLALFARK